MTSIKASVKAKLRPSLGTDQPGSVFYQIIRHRTARRITTDYKVFSDEWDSSTGTVAVTDKDDSARLQDITSRMNCDLAVIDGIIDDLDKTDGDYTADDVVDEYKLRCGRRTFFRFTREVISRLKQMRRTATARNYTAAISSFTRFRAGKDITLEDVDCDLMEDYQTYLIDRGLTPNTVSFYMRVLRAVYNRAVNQDLITDKRPFRSVFTGMEKTAKRAISVHDLQRLFGLDLSKVPELEMTRDIFFFLFFCRGMSFIDAAYLKKTDIRFGVITYRRHKTGQKLMVKMEKAIEDIIKRHQKKDSPYVLPIIRKPGLKERSQYEGCLHRVNKNLKYIGAMADISIPLTTYVSRHTWATIAKYKNVPISVISDALGHDSQTTTQIYLASIDSAVIDRANELIIKILE